MGKYKVAPRVQGKVMQLPSGSNVLVIELMGKHIWRGKHKSLHDAIEAGDAGLGVDRILLKRAMKYHDVKSVLIIVEEQRRVFGAAIDKFFDERLSSTRSHWDGRAHRVLGYQHFTQKYLGPDLCKRRKRAKTCDTTHTRKSAA